MDETAMIWAERVDVTAMNVMRSTATAPPLPATAMAAYGRARPFVTSELVIAWDIVSGGLNQIAM